MLVADQEAAFAIHVRTFVAGFAKGELAGFIAGF